MIKLCKNLNPKIFLISLLCLPLLSRAADTLPDHLNCPAGKVAVARQGQVLKEETAEIEELEQESQSLSDEFSKCIGGLAIDIKIPTFPSLSDIWETMKKEICKIAKNKLDSQKQKYKIPSSLDPWGEAMQHIPQTDYNHLLSTSNQEFMNTRQMIDFSDTDVFPWSLD